MRGNLFDLYSRSTFEYLLVIRSKHISEIIGPNIVYTLTDDLLVGHGDQIFIPTINQQVSVLSIY